MNADDLKARDVAHTEMPHRMSDGQLADELVSCLNQPDTWTVSQRAALLREAADRLRYTSIKGSS